MNNVPHQEMHQDKTTMTLLTGSYIMFMNILTHPISLVEPSFILEQRHQLVSQDETTKDQLLPRVSIICF